jgi:hypothetical protein
MVHGLRRMRRLDLERTAAPPAFFSLIGKFMNMSDQEDR